MPIESSRPSDDSLNAYLRSLSRIPKIQPDEADELLHELSRLRRLGDESWRDVRDRVVLHHLRLVIRTARRLRYGSVPLIDLIQEGNLGLMRAVERFDVDRGVPFPSYAAWWIRRNILRALEDQGRTVRVSADGWALDRRVRGFEREQSVRCGEKFSIEEIAGALQVPAARVDGLRGSMAGSLSCDALTPAGNTTLGELLADPAAAPPDQTVAERWQRGALARGLAEIDERARKVLVLRWGLSGGLPLTQSQVGRKFGISGARVCQLEKAALARLRRCPVLRKLAGHS
jgi:RNA polymerase sigma factor (sigma-70 family)